jgi:hypothetical protein
MMISAYMKQSCFVLKLYSKLQLRQHVVELGIVLKMAADNAKF